MKTPTTAKTGATTPTLIAIICAVMVVPILEPITTQIHLFNVIKLAFMKPINITVTAEELCTAAVTPIPTRTPLNFVFVSFSKIVFKRLLRNHLKPAFHIKRVPAHLISQANSLFS